MSARKLVRDKVNFLAQERIHKNLFLGLVASWLLGYFCHLRTHR